MSSPEFAGTIPVSPPMANKKMNPKQITQVFCIVLMSHEELVQYL